MRPRWSVMATVCCSLALAIQACAEEAPPRPSGFGFGGPMIGLVRLDLTEVNPVLEASGYEPLAGELVAWGGGGAGGVIGGISFGGSGWGGSVSSAAEGRSAELSLGFGGVDLTYTVRGKEDALLSFGAVAGGGALDLSLRERVAESFEDAVARPTTTTLSRGFFGLEPYVRFDVRLLSWIGLKLQIGYLFAFPGSWQDGESDVTGPDVPLSGPYVGVAVTFGGFGPAEMQTGAQKTDNDVFAGLFEDEDFRNAACPTLAAVYETHCGPIGESPQLAANEELAREAFRAMHAWELRALEPLVAEDVSWVAPDGFVPWGGTWVGKPAFLNAVRGGRAILGAVQIDHILSDGEDVAIKWHRMPGPDGGPIAYGVTIFRIVDGLILSGRDYRN